MQRKTFHLDGVLLLDKPPGITSNAALQRAKKLFCAKKAGHTGSLDPLATGMLPLCFGEATKFSQFLLNADKTYRVTAKLGIKTTTGDVEGEIVEQRPVNSYSDLELKKVLEKFLGTISQVPSMYSALKHKGRPLYELARQGITVPRAAREVEIKRLVLLERTADTFTLELDCSKGTYVRTLIEDIGEMLGCGGHVIVLRRLKVAGFLPDQMVTVDQLEKVAEADMPALKNFLLPIQNLVTDWNEVIIWESALFYLQRGQPVVIPRAPTSGWVKLMTREGTFLGVGEILDDGRVAPKRLVRLP